MIRQSVDTDGQIAEYSHGTCCGTGADLAFVFVEGSISDPVEPVFDAPVASNQCCQLGRVAMVDGSEVIRQTTSPVASSGWPGCLRPRCIRITWAALGNLIRACAGATVSCQLLILPWAFLCAGIGVYGATSLQNRYWYVVLSRWF